MDKSKKSTLEGMATYDTLSAEPTNESETVSEILKMPQFKKRNKSVRLSGNVSSIDNTNLTEILKTMLIDRNICTEKDFK